MRNVKCGLCSAFPIVKYRHVKMKVDGEYKTVVLSENAYQKLLTTNADHIDL